MAKNQILGLPWWAVAGGAALGIFLLTRKKAVAAPSKAPGTNYLVQPTGGWAYPPMTPATFGSWCSVNNGVPMGSNTCMISGKGVYKLVGTRLKKGDEWVLTDDDLF